MKKLVLAVVFLAMVLLGGCWDLKIVEDLAMVLALGVDQDQDDMDLLSFTFANPAFSEEAEMSTVKTVVKARNLPQAILNVQQQRDRVVVLGQMNTLVFDEDTARNGQMHQILLDIDQMRDVNPNALLAVVEEDMARAVLQLEPPEETRVAVFLTNMLERNQLYGMIPLVSIFRYWQRYTQPGIDPVVPLIRLTGYEDEKSGLMLSGLAVFNGQGRMVGKLSDDETWLYMILTQQFRRGRFLTQWEVGGSLRPVSMFIKGVSKRVQTDIIDGRPRIAVSLEIDVDIQQIEIDIDAMEEDTFAFVAKRLARDFQGNIHRLIKKTQAWQADIGGLGRFVRIQHPRWFDSGSWPQAYRDSHITVEVKVNVKRIGTLVTPKY